MLAVFFVVRRYVLLFREFHYFVEGCEGVVSADGVAFCVAYMVVCRDEDADCICRGWKVREKLGTRGKYRVRVQERELLMFVA